MLVSTGEDLCRWADALYLGFNAELFIDPANSDCVTVLSNDFFGEPSRLAEPLWSFLAK